MTRALTLLLIFIGALGALAQTVAAGSGASPAAHATVEGIVTKDPGGESVKKVLIELIAENQNEGGDYTAVTGADGAFRIEHIVPGRYHLFAERTGYLEVDKHRTRTDGRVVTLTAGDEMKDLAIRLQAAAVVTGRVTDEDGDPMPNAQAAVLRQTYASGRSHWEQAGAEVTNDLGEFRVAGLPSGNYYVSVSPPPDFKTLINAASKIASSNPTNAADGTGGEKPAATSYQTTYYPGTRDRAQAASIALHPGDEFPVSFSLTPAPSLTIRGTVASLPPRASAAIMLQSHDFNLMFNGAEMHSDGSFVIHDVAPGAYSITATVENSSVPMMARQSLQVVSADVDGVRLAPQMGASLRGRLHIESKNGGGRFDSSQVFLALRSADGEDDVASTFTMEGFSNITHLSADGSFEWTSVPPGKYFVELAGDAGANPDCFLKTVSSGGRDVSDSGLTVSGGTIVMDVVASANGAVADGVAINPKGVPVANAVIVAVPDIRLRTRVDRYRKTVSDQNGRFTLRGLPPGNYTVFAWESVDGDAYYNPEFLAAYEGQGKNLQAGEGDRVSVQIQTIAAPGDHE